MQSVIKFLKKILLVIELFFVILFVHWDKVLFVGIIALDQFCKALVVNRMTPGESIPVINDFFHITYLLNPGAAFGILPNQRMFFIAAGILLLAVGAYFYPKLKKTDTILKFGAVTLVSGAVANLIDRAQSGLVVDFLDFRVWPIFNIADVAIILGTFVIIYAVIFTMGEVSEVEEVRR